MRIRGFARTLSLTLTATVASVAIIAAPTPALADTNDTVTSAEVAAALNKTDSKNDNLVGEPIPTKTDADSAAVVTTTDGTLIDIPKDAEEGVTLGAKGEAPITIGLPGTDDASGATKLADGTIVYAGSEGVANAVVPTEGGVQMLTTIANSGADTRFTYDVDTPDGGSIQLIGQGAVVLDGDNNPVLTVPAPWARDAMGVTVPAHFETDGTTLTMVVEHTSGNFAYPVVADPWWSWIWGLVKFTAKKIGPGMFVLCATGAGWAWFRSDAQGWLRVGDAVAGCLL